MNIFKTRMWAWWELGIVKWSSFLCGVAVGAFWSGVFAPYVLAIVSAGLVLGVIGLVLWLKK
jgi:hypothetical protein